MTSLHDLIDNLEANQRIADLGAKAAAFTVVHDHPVLELIRDRRRAAQYADPVPSGAAVQQTITLAEAHALREHLEKMREQHEQREWQRPWLRVEMPTIPESAIAPGSLLGAVYGVQITIENPHPVIAETRGGDGLVGRNAILTRLLPVNTHLHKHLARVLTPWSAADRAAVRAAKESLARLLGEPHILADLGAEDLLPDEAPVGSESYPKGWRVLCAATFRAIPWATEYIVTRPSPSLPAGWLPPRYDGQWITRPGPHSVYVHLMRGTGLEMEFVVATANPTGRVEIRDDGATAEVYEITAPPWPTPGWIPSEGEPLS
ncbi:hypothetical protein GCM10022252_75070 [Streptosporangium oxazolinicum]|uniref:Uncharacterized protein n=1 Tax=Streptosporangium oxazolinicum TaxID=909287 RepID=A0ABP8BLM9_9ACTN